MSIYDTRRNNTLRLTGLTVLGRVLMTLRPSRI